MGLRICIASINFTTVMALHFSDRATVHTGKGAEQIS